MGLYYSQVHDQKPLAAGTTVTFQVPTGGKICSFVLRFTTSAGADVTEAQIRAEIGNIRLTMNGQDVVNSTVNRILDAYENFGIKVNTPAGVGGVVELNLGRLLMIDPAAKDTLGFGTADISTIQVQVACGTLSAIANCQIFTQRLAVNENLGYYCRFIDYAQSFNATGDHTVDTLPRDLNSAYLMLQIDDGASGVINTSEVRVNTLTVRERVPLSVNALFNSNGGFAQASGYFVHQFSDGSLATRLPMPGVTDLRVITNFSTAPGAGGYVISALTLVAAGDLKIV